MAELQEQVNKIQLLEQNVQAIAAQKQQVQTQVFEIDSALKELENSTDSFKIIANIMVKTSKEQLTKELTEKKELFDLRIQTLEKQEKDMKEKMKEIQTEVMKNTPQK